jgi:hypothetical protein
MVEAFDVLPSITLFAIDRVPVVVRVVTYAFDRIRLFLDRVRDNGRIFIGGPGSSIEGRL